jgi:hypothetical protein
MSTIPVLPILSGSGWCNDPGTILVHLFKHMVVADHSQSTIFHGNITSLPWVISVYEKDPDMLMVRLEEAIKRYISAYLTNVSVDVKYSQDTKVLYNYEIFLSINGYYNNVYCELVQTLNVNNGQIANILNLINQ